MPRSIGIWSTVTAVATGCLFCARTRRNLYGCSRPTGLGARALGEGDDARVIGRQQHIRLALQAVLRALRRAARARRPAATSARGERARGSTPPANSTGLLRARASHESRAAAMGTRLTSVSTFGSQRDARLFVQLAAQPALSFVMLSSCDLSPLCTRSRDIATEAAASLPARAT